MECPLIHRTARGSLLRADIDRLSTGTDGSYALVLYLQNNDTDAPMFVTAPAVRAFIQVDRDWVEVLAQSIEKETDGVLSLTGRQIFRFTFKPEVARYTELVPGSRGSHSGRTMPVG